MDRPAATAGAPVGPGLQRRQARELAMQALFARDVGQGRPQDMVAYLCQDADVPPETALYARTLVDGVMDRLAEIDRRIAAQARDWSLMRLAAVDRNVLRVAVHELAYARDAVPEGVAINEAVEIAKAYGGDDSGRFVNGILGQLARDQ